MPNGPKNNLVGKVFNRLTVLEYIKGGKWKCRCDCGKETVVTTGHLTSGHTQSCGCLQKENASKKNCKDIIGQTFGELKVLSRNQELSTANLVKYNCLCSCGKEIVVPGAYLRSGNTKSCGCMTNKLISISKTKNLSGQRFGKLVAIRPIYSQDSKRNGTLWECQCDCGNTCLVAAQNLLQKNHTKSCGCLKSTGEEAIIKLLQENNIQFKKEYTFDNCVFPDTRYKAKFDFWVNNQYLIEYDGMQHYNPSYSGWDTEEHFKRTQKNDNYKNQWCKDNNIPLIRIPYTQLNKLTISDLLLESSQFIINNKTAGGS